MPNPRTLTRSRLLLAGLVLTLMLGGTVAAAASTSTAGGDQGTSGDQQAQDAQNRNRPRVFDSQDVLNTLFQWSEGYDERKPELMRDAFTHDARFIYASPAFTEPLVYNGIDEVMGLFEGALASQNDHRRHVDTNSQVHQIDRTTVKVTTYLTLLVVADPNVSPILQSTGVYRDTLVLERDGKWRIKERDLRLDTAA